MTKRGRLRKVHQDIGFLEELDKSIKDNGIQLEKKLIEANEKLQMVEIESKSKLQELENQVNLLLAKLDASTSEMTESKASESNIS